MVAIYYEASSVTLRYEISFDLITTTKSPQVPSPAEKPSSSRQSTDPDLQIFLALLCMDVTMMMNPGTVRGVGVLVLFLTSMTKFDL